MRSLEGSIAETRCKIRQAVLPLVVGTAFIAGHADLAAAQSGPPRITAFKHVVGQEPPVKIVNGVLTTWYPTTGALLYVRGLTKFGSWCSGTLIGCNRFLTAGHCIAEDDDPRDYRVFLQHGGVFDVASIAWQKAQYVKPNSATGANADIAVLTLAKSVTGIRPQGINEGEEHADGVGGTIAGFGRTGGQNIDYGLKRFGTVTVARCRPNFSQSELICWNYTGQQSSNTCNGDSGGPLFLSQGSRPEVVSGVTSGGLNLSCQATDHSFDTSVFRHKDWIRSVAGSDLGQATCGSLPPMSSDDHRQRSFQGAIGDANGIQEHAFEVEIQGTRELRASVNLGLPIGLDKAKFLTRPELHIYKGKAGEVGQPACTSKEEAQAGSCSVENVSDGTYTIVLKRAGGTGEADVQLVVSVF